ncbi:hypothetical protein [Pseudovibrio brasiliensis]|nr:hypothetical protein [Pseudovibrio brasiliensis]
MAGLATAGHSHEMAKINGLAEALELLAAKDHSHTLDELADVEVEGASDGKILQKIAGKWGLGDRGYTASEINNIVAGLAASDHQHTITDVTGLSAQLANIATELAGKAGSAAVSQALSEKAAKSEALLLTKARVTDDGRFEINKGTVESPNWVEYRSGGGLPVGHVSWCFFSRPLPGHIFLENQIISKAMYPELYAWALPDAVPAATRKAGQWAKIDGKDELRAPDTEGYFLRSLEAGREIGSAQEDAFKQHSHAQKVNGYDYDTHSTASHPHASGTTYSMPARWSTARTSEEGADETRPRNLAYKLQIKAFDIISDPALVQAASVVSKVDELIAEVSALKASQSGIGQQWHDVKAQRSVGTVYSNPTMRPMGVYVSGIKTSWGHLEVSDNGTNWIIVGEISGAYQAQMFTEVPPNHFYRVTGGIINYWAERR